MLGLPFELPSLPVAETISGPSVASVRRVAVRAVDTNIGWPIDVVVPVDTTMVVLVQLYDERGKPVTTTTLPASTTMLGDWIVEQRSVVTSIGRGWEFRLTPSNRGSILVYDVNQDDFSLTLRGVAV